MSGSRGGQSQFNPGTEATGIVLIIVMVLTAMTIWHFFRAPIAYFCYGADYGQYWFLSKLNLLDEEGLKWMKWIYAAFDGRRDVRTIDWADIWDPQKDIGRRMKWFYIAITVVLAAAIIMRMRGDGFKSSFNLTGRAKATVWNLAGWEGADGFLQFLKGSPKLLPGYWLFWLLSALKVVGSKKKWVNKGKSFAHFQAQHWKVSLVGAEFDPDAMSALELPSRTPMEFLRDHKISLTRRDGLDEAAATAVFEAQLGPTWLGVDTAPVHLQAIFAMCVLNLDHSKEVDVVRDRLAELYLHGTSPAVEQKVRAMITPILQKKKYKGFLAARGGKFAFQNTAAIGIYGYCGPNKEWGGGKTGVLAPAAFRWLKKIDRTLWYCLNNVGRRSFLTEGAGAVAHFFAERVGGSPLAAPMVDYAVDGLSGYIEDSGIVDLEEFFLVESDF